VRGTILFVVTSVWATGTVAADYPSRGLVSNSSGSIQYNCSLKSGLADEMSCQMVKVSIRRGADPYEPQAAIDSFVKSTKDAKPKDNCEVYSRFVEQFRAFKPADWNSKQFEVNEQQKQDEIRHWQALFNQCKSPSVANATEVVRAVHDKDLRTCTISTHVSSLTFRRVGNDTWIANAGPADYDPCGSVEMSRFEKSKLSISDGWAYTIRTTVANPNGESIGEESCKAFEAEYSYEPLGIDHYARCDYIKFEQWEYPELSPPGSIVNHRLEEIWQRRK
jgi:hypothetical protein